MKKNSALTLLRLPLRRSGPESEPVRRGWFSGLVRSGKERLGLLALLLVFLVSYLSIAAFLIWRDYSATIDRAQHLAGAISSTVAEHAGRNLADAERLLMDISGELAAQQLPLLAQEDVLLARLVARKQRALPALTGIAIVRSDESIVASSKRQYAGTDGHSAQLLLAHQANPGMNFQLAAGPTPEGGQGPLALLSHAVSSADGSLRFIVVIGLGAQYFESYYRSLSFDRTASLALTDRAGTVFASSSPHSADALGKAVTSLLAQAAGDGAHAVKIGDKIIGVGQIDGLPLVGLAILPSRDVLKPTRTHMLHLASIFAVFGAVVVCLVVILWRRLNENARQTRALQHKNASLALAAQVFEGSLHTISIFSPRGTIWRANAALQDMTGFSSDEVAERRPTMFGGCMRTKTFRRRLFRALRKDGVWQGEGRVVTKDGRLRILNQSISLVRNPETGVACVVGIFYDVTEEKEAQQRLFRLAHFDALTEMANRHHFVEQCNSMIRGCAEGDRNVVMVFSIDHFKRLNDGLGYATGDRVLVELAQRLNSVRHPSAYCARLGDDDFGLSMILAPGQDAEDCAVDYVAKLQEPMLLDGREVHLTLSVGVSLYPQHGDDADALLRHAGQAMYSAAQRGGNMITLFDNSMTVYAEAQMRLFSALRQAVNEQQFQLYYQPQSSLASGQIVGVEALLRWFRPGQGMVPPLEFIPLAEESGLILPIGEWVLRTACQQGAAWYRDGYTRLRVGVNVAAKQLRQPGFVQMVADALRDTGLPPSCLELEVTESSVIENLEEAIPKLCALKGMGVSLAMDDFGTGYSSLSYLKQLPLDRLKIDRSFVLGVPGGDKDVAIMKAIISMARFLGLETIAEGVEDMAQFEFLRDCGCVEMQGYLLSPPVTPSKATALLESDYEIRHAVG